jgi:NTP pyrophosphatase (non-canonical NTP hydrolase)
MTLNDYQKKAIITAIYPSLYAVVYPALGLSGEAGEVAEKVKKIIRDKSGVVDEATKEAIKKELGDVLWYVSALSRDLGFTLEEVAQANIDKLTKRHQENKIHGEGDDR